MPYRDKEDKAKKDKEYQIKNKNNLAEQRKIYREKNKEKINNTIQLWKKNKIENYLYSKAKYRAKVKNIVFSLAVSDINVPEYCPYLNIKLTRIVGHGHIQSNASLDRIDNTKGYTKDNIEVISHLANCMKRDATKVQLVSFAKEVLKRYGNP